MNDSISALIFIGLIVLAVVGLGVVQPYLEAKAFNECTGGNASYFTAAFTELRVENCNR